MIALAGSCAPGRRSKELGPVECEEGDWGPWSPMTNLDVNTACWAGVRPSFLLLTRDQAAGLLLANTPSQLLHLQPAPRLPALTRLAVLIHGYQSSSEGDWRQLSHSLLLHDSRLDAVLLVDWRFGANPDGVLDIRADYHQAAANTRYVGVATERVLRQLNQTAGLHIHCLGHSLGAHACGFLGQAVQVDTEYNNTVARITGLDPAGPGFTAMLRYSWNLLQVRSRSIDHAFPVLMFSG